MADEAIYTKSAQEVDYERRLAAEAGDPTGGVPDSEPRVFAVEGNDLSGYVGVAPEYMTYANSTEAPAVADGGAGAVFEKRLRSAPAGVVGEVSKPVEDDEAAPPEPREGSLPADAPSDATPKGTKSDAPKGAPARN